MKGTVIQFRQGRHTQKPRHFLIEIPSCDSREKAQKFVDSKVVWTSPGKDKNQISGVIKAPHGNKGVARAIFEKGLPGQAIGTEVEVSAKESKTKTEKKKNE